MKFWQFLSATQNSETQGLTEVLADQLAALMTRGHSIADLLNHYGDEFGHLPPERLRRLAAGFRRWQSWRRRRDQLQEARERAAAPRLPDDVFLTTPTPDQLDATIRAARACPRELVDSDAAWSSIIATGADLWRRCVALCRQHGSVRTTLTRLDHPDAARYDGYVKNSEPLAELQPHRWLAMRRGQRDGVLTLELEIPEAQLLAQVQLFQGRLGPAAAAREASSLLVELVLDDLRPWLLQILDAEAESQAIATAADALAGLLRSTPVQARRVGAVYVNGGQRTIAAITVERDGEIISQRVLKPEGSWLDKIAELFQEHGAHQVVVPAGNHGSDDQTAIETRLAAGGVQLVKIRAAALAEARRPLTDPPLRLGSSVASALVLARRALDPLREWALIDPVSIGLAEYQHDLDTDRLRAALTETVELCRLERRRGGKSSSMGAPVARGGGAMARLNALVRTLADLRPGMKVHGVVSNISHFGAFVNIGLPQEGLVHISELSDQFVSNPNEVVAIGQQVTAHVLSVDHGRGRISLSLKTRVRVADADEGRRLSGGGARSTPMAARPATKAEALASLERLFRKL